jgi:hypothetical protein
MFGNSKERVGKINALGINKVLKIREIFVCVCVCVAKILHGHLNYGIWINNSKHAGVMSEMKTINTSYHNANLTFAAHG